MPASSEAAGAGAHTAGDSSNASGGGGGASASGSGGGGGADRVGLVVFCRLPVAGRVKTRLAAGAGVGPQRACDFYSACAEHALTQAARCCPWADAYVYHSSDDATAEVAAWLAGVGLGALPCVAQLSAAVPAPTSVPAAAPATAAPAVAPPADLGAKMLAALADVRRRGGHRKLLITGTDIPDMSAELLRAAADALDEHQMVVGPALDGGYYMLGLTVLEQSLFQGMRWSTEAVLSETLARAAAAGLRVAPLATLPPLRDVDTVEDLGEWVASQRASSDAPSNAPSSSGGGGGGGGEQPLPEARGAAVVADEAGAQLTTAQREEEEGEAGAAPAAVLGLLAAERRRRLLEVSGRVLDEAAAASCFPLAAA